MLRLCAWAVLGGSDRVVGVTSDDTSKELPEVSVPELDRLRVVELALLHDLAEVRTGDLPRTAARYFPPGAKQEAERQALVELLAPLDPSVQARLAEYEAGSSREARFVRVCDQFNFALEY